MTFYTGTQFPADYRGDMFAAFHGSWNRSHRTGYKIDARPGEERRADRRGTRISSPAS